MCLLSLSSVAAAEAAKPAEAQTAFSVRLDSFDAKDKIKVDCFATAVLLGSTDCFRPVSHRSSALFSFLSFLSSSSAAAAVAAVFVFCCCVSFFR